MAQKQSQEHLRRHSVSVSVNEILQGDILTAKDGQINDKYPLHTIQQLEEHTRSGFTSDDPRDPKNWSKAFKWYCTMVVAFTCFVVTFNSSVVTADINGVSKQFNVSDEVSLLTVTLLVIGFGLGAFSA